MSRSDIRQTRSVRQNAAEPATGLCELGGCGKTFVRKSAEHRYCCRACLLKATKARKGAPSDDRRWAARRARKAALEAEKNGTRTPFEYAPKKPMKSKARNSGVLGEPTPGFSTKTPLKSLEKSARFGLANPGFGSASKFGADQAELFARFAGLEPRSARDMARSFRGGVAASFVLDLLEKGRANPVEGYRVGLVVGTGEGSDALWLIERKT